jgi:hypothetical protein
MRTAGIIGVIISGLIFVAAVGLLDWAGLPTLRHVGGTIGIVSHGATLWSFPGHQAGVLTVVAVGTVALAAMGLLSNSVITALPAVCGSFYLLGQTFPVGGEYGYYEVGFWLATAAALAMSIAGAFAVASAVRFTTPVADNS